MFSDYEQEAHVRYRINGMYEDAETIRRANTFRTERKPATERRRRNFWDAVTHGFRQSASPV